MEIRLLGLVGLWSGNHRVQVGTPQAQCVLAALALAPNQPVSVDALVDRVWGEAVPGQARNSLYAYISRLRWNLIEVSAGATAIRVVHDGGGYLLEVDPKRVDLHRARELAAEARMALDTGDLNRAAALLRDSVGLWRGTPLAGVPGEWAGRVRDTLIKERLAVLTHRFEVEIRLGRHREIIGALAEAAGEFPLAEALIGQLMLALHRSGRHAEALELYRRTRLLLADQLGSDPGPELARLHQAILRRDPELEPPEQPSGRDADPSREIAPQWKDASQPDRLAGNHESQVLTPVANEPVRFTVSVPQLLPPDIADFTGREKEFGLLLALMRGGASQGVGLAAVSGRGGVGKTALCVRVAHALRTDFPDGQLYVNLHGVGNDRPATPHEVLGRFLRLLGVDGTAIPDALEERVELYRDLLGGRRVLVVLDNAVSDDQVRPLIPGGRGCGVMIGGRTRLGASFGAYAIHLDVFNAGEAIDLLGRIAGPERVTAEPDAATELSGHCGHLPLAIRVVGAKLAVRPHWTVQKLAGLLRNERQRLDHFTHGQLDVRASMALSYTGLSQGARLLLRHLGHLDLPEVAPWLAAALLGADASNAEDLLDQLVDSHLLDVTVGDFGSARYRMHDLVRLFAKERAEEEEPSEVLDAARDRAFGAWLSTSDAAYRGVYGGDYQVIHGPATRWAVGEPVAKMIADDPLGWFETERPAITVVVGRAAANGRSDVCWELACATSPLFQMRRYFEESEALLDLALGAAREAGDDVGVAAVMHRLGILYSDRSDRDRAAECLQEAVRLFERAGHRHGQATALAFVAMIDRFRGDVDVALDRYERARAMLRELADHGGEAFTLRGIGQIHLDRGSYAEADAYFERALASCRRTGSRKAEAQILFFLGMLRVKQERFEQAEPLFTAVLSACREMGDRSGEGQALRGLALCYGGTGDTDRARLALTEALRIAHQPRPTLLEETIRRAIAELDSM